MASAWGSSWGSAWGNSWGSGSTSLSDLQLELYVASGSATIDLRPYFSGSAFTGGPFPGGTLSADGLIIIDTDILAAPVPETGFYSLGPYAITANETRNVYFIVRKYRFIPRLGHYERYPQPIVVVTGEISSNY